MTRADHTFRTTAGHPAAVDIPGGQSGGHPLSFLEFDGQAQCQGLLHASDQRLARPLADRLVIQREDLFDRTGRDSGNRLDPDCVPVGGRVPGLHCALLDEDQGRQDVPADAAGGAVSSAIAPGARQARPLRPATSTRSRSAESPGSRTFGLIVSRSLRARRTSPLLASPARASSSNAASTAAEPRQERTRAIHSASLRGVSAATSAPAATHRSAIWRS